MGYNLDTQSNSESEFADALTKASELDAMRIYKPWLYPDIIFSLYTRITGKHKVYKALHKLPNQVIKEMKIKYAQKKLENKCSNIDVTDSESESFVTICTNFTSLRCYLYCVLFNLFF
uniref:Cytochrome p450 n=1 Tax=Sipha flava TaxID=143950 RepID=A0A2S2R2L3_9HEMI